MRLYDAHMILSYDPLPPLPSPHLHLPLIVSHFSMQYSVTKLCFLGYCK